MADLEPASRLISIRESTSVPPTLRRSIAKPPARAPVDDQDDQDNKDNDEGDDEDEDDNKDGDEVVE